MSTATATGRAVPVRVELPAGQTAVLHLREGGTPVTLDASTLAALLSEGLDTPERATDAAASSGTVHLGTLEVGQGVTFLVGHTPLPTDLALEAIVRGIVCALRLCLRALASSPREGETGAQHARVCEEEALRAERPPLTGFTRVPVEVAEAGFEELVDRVAQGERIALTREDEVAAVLVPWGQYARLRERAARLEASYWATQGDGAAEDSDD